MSLQKKPKTEQIQPSPPLKIVLWPVALDPLLPIFAHTGYVQRDRPIRYLHLHDCLELGLCHHGSGVFMVGQKVLPFRAGDVSVINHTEVHLAQSAPGTDSEWSWVYLDPIRLVTTFDATIADATPFAGVGFGNIFDARTYPEIGRVVQRLIDELTTRASHYATAVRVLTAELMTLLHRLPTTPQEPAEAAFVHDQLAPALQHLAGHFRDPVDVRGLAARCHLSPTHFRRLFLRAIGKTPRAYWLDLRIRMATSLLQATGRSVLEVSQDVGFDSLSSFNRQFLKAIRTTPRAWRRSTRT